MFMLLTVYAHKKYHKSNPKTSVLRTRVCAIASLIFTRITLYFVQHAVTYVKAQILGWIATPVISNKKDLTFAIRLWLKPSLFTFHHLKRHVYIIRICFQKYVNPVIRSWICDTLPRRSVSQGSALVQLCPTQMAYWAKNYVNVLTWAAHWMTY